VAGVVLPNTYRNLDELLNLIPEVSGRLRHFTEMDMFKNAAGSSHNHQAWEGGYFDHVVETMNIACWLYETSPRVLPFTLTDALTVLFLHDLEKPFKEIVGSTWKTKDDRRDFRETLIQQNQIPLTAEQKNALLYVMFPLHYSGTERKMKPLAAFCHTCDILSARLWWNRGKEHAW
jgi:hypothetical protein